MQTRFSPLLNLGRRVFLVAGDSMAPTLDTGDLVQACLAVPGQLRRGDLVAYHGTGGRRLIHRVVGLHPLRTRGDACLADDPPPPRRTRFWRAFLGWRAGCRRLVRLEAGAAGRRRFRRLQLRLRVIHFKTPLRPLSRKASRNGGPET